MECDITEDEFAKFHSFAVCENVWLFLERKETHVRMSEWNVRNRNDLEAVLLLVFRTNKQVNKQTIR